MDSDFKALAVANKALCIIFIILIVAINALVIWKHVRKTKFYFSPKSMIIISLAIGDVILALFPLIIYAVALFEHSIYSVIDDCRLKLAYETYLFFLIHFVFGLGLMLMGTEILLRDKLQKLSFTPKPLVAVAVSSIPWLLGLLIVVPICVSKAEYSVIYSMKCYTLHSPETKYAVSVFVPAALTLIYSIIVMVIKIPEMSAAHNETRVEVVSQSMSKGQGAGENIPVNHLETTPSAPTEDHLYFVDQEKPATEHHVLIQLPAPSAQQGAASIGHRHPDPLYESKSNARREKIRLLVMAVAYFVMIIPFGSFMVSDTTDFIRDDRLAFRIVVTFLTWLMVARSCVTPIILLSFRV